MQKLNMTIRQNIIRNFPVTLEYIDIAENKFGPDVYTLNERTTRQRKKVVVDYFIEIPRELIENNQEFILCMEIIFINQKALFTTIYKDIRFLGLVTISNITKEGCNRDLNVVIRYYNKAGFSVKRIECDGKFKQIMDEGSDDMGIEKNDANPDNHFHEAERNNIVIKERFRIAYYRFPYKKTPQIMIRHLAMNLRLNYNFFPAKGGVSDNYIPKIILSQMYLDYNKHFQVEFGAYVQVPQVDDPKNTNFLRTLDGIYLCPPPNFQGGYQIMDLRMGQLITGSKLVKITITYVVINAVKQMAEDQGFKSLKIYNRKYIIKKRKKLFSLMSIWQEWTTNNK